MLRWGVLFRLLWGKLRLGVLLSAFQQLALMAAGDFADGLALRLHHLAQTMGLHSESQLQQALDVSVQASYALVHC